MTEAEKDTQRAMAAGKAVLDGRDPRDPSERPGVLVTLDHLVATILLMAMNGNERNAVSMMHEGLVPAIEERIALWSSRAAK